MSWAVRNQLTPSLVYQLREMHQFCVFPNPFKEVGKEVSSLPCGTVPRWWWRELSAEPHPASLPCSQCWRASCPKLSTGGSLCLSGSKPGLMSLVKGGLAVQEPCGTFCAYQPRPSAKNHMTRTPLAPWKITQVRTCPPITILSGLFCWGEDPCLPLLQIRAGCLLYHLLQTVL